MKTSNIFLAVWLVIVAGLAFAAVYFLLLGDGDTDPYAAGENGGGNPVTVPPDDPNGNGERGPRVKPDKPTRKRFEPKIVGRVFGEDGEGAAGVSLIIGLPVTSEAPPETMVERDIRKIYDVIYMDPEEWDQPRPLSAWRETALGSSEAGAASQEIARGSSDETGKFEIDLPRHLGTGPFRLAADGGALGKASAQGVRANQSIELTLGPVSKATGTVLSGNENAGIGGATVILDDGETRFRGTSGDDGTFEIEGVAPGKYRVSAGADDHPPILGEEMEIKQGEPLDIRLPRGTTLVVTTVIETLAGDDQILPDAEIVVMEQNTLSYVLGRSDLNGVAKFDGLPPGIYLINGRGERAISFGEELAPIKADALTAEVELLFEPAIDTPITVVDESGNPVAGVSFYTSNHDDEYDALRSVRVPGETDARGNFTFAFEFEGPRAQVFGFKTGYSMVRAYPDDHEEGAPMRLVARAGLRVHGLVRTPGGTPIPDAIVLLEVEPSADDDDDDYSILIRSGKDGRYDFPYVPHGEIYVSAEHGENDWSDDYDVELIDGQSEYRIDIEMDLE